MRTCSHWTSIGADFEREIGSLAEAGDPGMAARLGELSGLLRRMTRVSDELRARLDALRAQLEGRPTKARRADRITPESGS